MIGVGLMGNGPQALKRIAVQEKFRWVDALKGHSKVAQAAPSVLYSISGALKGRPNLGRNILGRNSTVWRSRD